MNNNEVKVFELVEKLIEQVELSAYTDEFDHDLRMNVNYINVKTWFAIQKELSDTEVETYIDDEIYREYDFISECYKRLTEAQKVYDQLLRKPENKLNVNFMVAKERMDHDIKVLTPLVQKLGFEIMAKLEVKHDIKLKFLTKSNSEQNDKPSAILKPN